MADTSGQADIRGIDIDKLAKGFADESNIFKKFVNVSKTKAREIRWYSKTSGFLNTSSHDSATEGVAAGTLYSNVSERARPAVAEQSWTRSTSYVRKYFMESPTISIEDIKDCDIDILAGNVRDLVRAVQRMVDSRIYTVLSTATGVQTGAATADGWDDVATGDPIGDILTAKQAIRAYGYNPEGGVLAINSIEHKNLLKFLINVKGSSIPQFASEKITSGVVMEILGLKVVVSENCTTDQALIFTKDAATWKEFMPITSVVIDEPGIGKKIRAWEEGECINHDPKACYLLTDTVV